MPESAPTKTARPLVDDDLPPEVIAISGPYEGLRQRSSPSKDARLVRRPMLCSDCGVRDSALKPLMPFGLLGRALRHLLARASTVIALLTTLWTADVLAGLSAELSSTNVAAGQPVILTLTLTGPGQPALDLTALDQDFQITNRGTREEVSIVNGQRRERRELRLTLMPRRTGMLTIPALRAGDETTSPIELLVAATTTTNSTLLLPTAQTAAPEPSSTPPPSLSVEASIDPKRVRVAQQLLLVVRVTSSDTQPAGRLHEPKIDSARVLPLGEDRRAETTTDGEALQVYERRFAVFPSVAGTLEIPPLRFDAWRVAGGNPLPFDSDALVAQVEPIPGGAYLQAELEADKGAQPRTDNRAAAARAEGDRPWLPAKALSLTEAGPPMVRIAPGQALERMITLRAEGVMAEDLPTIPLAIPFQLRIRDDAPRLWNERTPEGVIGYRSERILIGTAEEGIYQLPGASINWWNTGTEEWQQAMLPDWTLTVAPFASADRRPAAIWSRPETEGSNAATGAPADDQTRAADSGEANDWQQRWARTPPWMKAIGTGIGIAAVILLLRMLAQRRAERPPSGKHRTEASGGGQVLDLPQDSTGGTSGNIPTPEELTSQTPRAAAVDAVEQAYRTGNATAARQALLHWATLLWPAAPPTNLAQLAGRLEPPLSDDILLLEKAFFSPRPIDWTQAPAWTRLEAAAVSIAGGA